MLFYRYVFRFSLFSLWHSWQVGLQLTIEQWFRKSLWVIFSKNTHSHYFILWPVNKSYTKCQLIYRVDLWYICSLRSDLSRHYVLANLLNMHLSLFMIWVVIKSDYICYIINCVEYGYKWWFNRYLSRHYVSAILRKIHSGFFTIWPMKK